MTLWAINENNLPVTGEKAIELRDKREQHSYTSPIYEGLSVTLRDGSHTLLVPKS
jgi:hypothetical protein